MPDDERLMAYVDGELTAPERARFEQQLDGDPELRRRLAEQQALRRRLSAAFDPILEEPPPLRLTLAAQTANAAGRWRSAQWAAMAACLALGVIVGRTALPQRGPLGVQDGGLSAQGRLASALDQRLAAEGGAVRVGVSFRTADGRYCRTFQSEPDRLAGLACRRPGGWAVNTITAWAPAGRPGSYRTAGSEMPAAVLAAVDAMMVGEPLDAAGERTARDRQWRP